MAPITLDPESNIQYPARYLAPFWINEAPRSKLRGIKAELRRSLTRLRSGELWRGSPFLSSLQQAAGIQAKANKAGN